jgi:hypothetical protein
MAFTSKWIGKPSDYESGNAICGPYGPYRRLEDVTHHPVSFGNRLKQVCVEIVATADQRWLIWIVGYGSFSMVIVEVALGHSTDGMLKKQFRQETGVRIARGAGLSDK